MCTVHCTVFNVQHTVQFEYIVGESGVRVALGMTVLFSNVYIFVTLHCKKRLVVFPSPAGMSLTKLSLAGNN